MCFDACAHPRRGTTKETRGTAYVVYEDIYDAKNACDHLSGFNVANRYLIVLYYNPQRLSKKVRAQGLVSAQAHAKKMARNTAAGACSRNLPHPAPLRKAGFALQPRPSAAAGPIAACYVEWLLTRVCVYIQGDVRGQEAALRKLQEQHGVDGEQHPQQPSKDK